MDQMTAFTIGGEQVLVPPMVFYSLERAWPHIQALGTSTDLVSQTSSALGIIAAGLALTDAPVSAEDLKRKLRGTELSALSEGITILLRNSGLVASGEVVATAALTETSGGSSPN